MSRVRLVSVLGVDAQVEYRPLEDSNGEYAHGKITLDPGLSDDMAAWVAKHEAAHMLIEMLGVYASWKHEFGEDKADQLEEQVICQVLLPFLQSVEVRFEDEV